MADKQLGNGSRYGAAAQNPMPLKQKVATGFKSLLESAKKLTIGDDAPDAAAATDGQVVPNKASIAELFTKVDPAVDGDDCLRDCESCPVHLPRSFKIDEEDQLYGFVKGWSTHLLVATGKTDWVRDVADEKGSVMQAVANARSPENGRLMLSASNIPTPHHTSDYSQPTTVLLLPAFTIIDDVTPAAVPTLIANFVENAPTNASPLAPVSLPAAPAPAVPAASPSTIPPQLQLHSRRCPHSAVILLCSQRTRDARCGQSAPLIRRELERHLRPLGLQRDLDDARPGGVGIYFISHVGGHKYSANVMVYRRPDAFGLDGVERGRLPAVEGASLAPKRMAEEEDDVGAAQCIWLARVRPEDCEGIVKFTVLQGKVIKPERQLRGGFDRSKGLLSW